MTLIVDFFLQLHTEKCELLKCLKSSKSEHLWTVNMLKEPIECSNLRGSIFLRFFDDSENKSAQKILF